MCWFVGALVGLLVCWFVGLLVCWVVVWWVCWFVGLLVGRLVVDGLDATSLSLAILSQGLLLPCPNRSEPA